MSKNVLIAEGSKSRIIGSCKKLKTSLQNSGSCLWVPEDEVQLEPLFVAENGVYRPDEYGFSEASVHVVDGNIGNLNANDNLAYFPDAGNSGYGEVKVNVPENKQSNFSDSVLIRTGGDSGYPYSWVVFVQDRGEDYEMNAYAYFWSKYPPFFNSDGNMAIFYDGVSGLKQRIIWDSYNYDYDSHPYPITHAYIDINLKYISDEWSKINNAILRPVDSSPNGTSYPPYEGQLESVVNRISKGFFLKIAEATLTKASSSSASLNGTTYRMATKSWLTSPESSNFWYSSKQQECDYRVFQGMSFESAAEWLAWCKAH